MIKSALAASAALSIIASPAAAAEMRDFELDPFTRIFISDGITASVKTGPEQSVRLEARNQDIIDTVSVTVANGTLRVHREGDLMDVILSGGLLNMFGKDNSVTVFVTMPELNAIDLSSGSRLDAESVAGSVVTVRATAGSYATIPGVAAGALSVGASAGSRVDLAGNCENLDLDLAAGSRISAESLTCLNVHINGSAGSSASVRAVGRADGHLSSGSSLELIGTPDETDVDTNSGASVRYR